MTGIHRRRPGAEAIAPAVEGEAVAIGEGLWMSPGVSNAYAVRTDEGRVVINAGLAIEGQIHRRAFDAVCSVPTTALVLTQGHPDHVGGAWALREDGTQVVMHSDHARSREDHHLLQRSRARNSAFAWSHVMGAMVAAMASVPTGHLELRWPEPDVVVDHRLTLAVGGRRIEVIAAPGGETSDSLVVWLPEDRTLFTGNLFGPLFGHVPNLVTMRGDRYRDARDYVASADLVLDLAPDRLVTGHFDPIEGADAIAEEVTALRDSMQWVHDRAVEGLEAGMDVQTLMREVRLPDRFDVGEGYGLTSWNVRAIWETYTGWFHHRSTTELYGVPGSALAADIVAAAGAETLTRAARQRLDAKEYVESLSLTDLVLTVDPADPSAREIARRAHLALLEGSSNFWERAWLGQRIDQLEPADDDQQRSRP